MAISSTETELVRISLRMTFWGCDPEAHPVEPRQLINHA